MSEEKKPKKQRKSTACAPPTEHKQPWQEKYASPEEIEQMLSQRVLLRYNEVRHRTEVHWLSQGPVIGEDEQGLLTIFGGDGSVTDGYENLTEYDVNTLWRKLCREKPAINERAAYERYHENRPHLASFCGTGNNLQFLSDTTGTRRWLPFEVESIESPLSQPFDHDAVFAQAYALYRQGFRYWFDRQEIERLQRHNEAFEAPNIECELVDQYFRKPEEGEVCEELPASVVLQTVGANMTSRLSAVMVGRALVELGYRYRLVHGCRRYQVVRRSADEMRLMRQTRSGGDGGDGGADS